MEQAIVLLTSDGRHVEASLETWVGAILRSLTPEQTQAVLQNLQIIQQRKIRVYSEDAVREQLKKGPIKIA